MSTTSEGTRNARRRSASHQGGHRRRKRRMTSDEEYHSRARPETSEPAAPAFVTAYVNGPCDSHVRR